MLGVIVFAHGSRDPLWRQPIESVAREVARSAPDAVVACAYLELCEPDLAQAAQALIDQGASRIRLLPLFFGMGKHAREDLPRIVADLRHRHAHIAFEPLAPVGEDPRLCTLLARIALESPA